jgi:hypothetical protein
VTVVLALALLPTSAWPAGAQPAAAAKALSGPQTRQVVDVSGVERFLEITAVLEQDKEPAPEQWDRLFATPGYAVLVAREFSKDDFANRFRLAFMPSKAAELDARIKRDTGFAAQFLPHYVRAKQARAEIERRVAAFRTAAFADEAIARARAFLPTGSTSEKPAVTFVVFAPDSRGYDPVVLDILYLSDREEFLNTVAHEFHHWYRAKLAPDLTRDADVLWTIQQVQLEGIADLINVPDWMTRSAETWSASNKQFVESYRRSPEIIRAIDDLFVRMHDEQGDRRDLGQQLRRAVPRSGHPTGYFMAETIVAALGRDALVRTVSNPFAFFRLYSEAARKKGSDSPAFSNKTLDFIASLETRYGK